jgi:hypothetical protein
VRQVAKYFRVCAREDALGGVEEVALELLKCLDVIDALEAPKTIFRFQ